MSLSNATKEEIKELLVNIVRSKLNNYNPETSYMPFHFRLLGKDRYAMASFLHSMSTTFGMSIWEQVAVVLAKGQGNYGERQFKLLGEIDNKTENVIQEIYYRLRKGELISNKIEETERIRKIIAKGEKKKDPDSVVDVLINIGTQENCFDITSAKPNMKEFASLKLKLLRWTALRLSYDVNANVYTRLAIPYNPYHPEPYERWTLKGLFDLEHKEILVGDEFWNFVACDNIYEKLLDIFEDAGTLLKTEIEKKFAEFKQEY